MPKLLEAPLPRDSQSDVRAVSNEFVVTRGLLSQAWAVLNARFHLRSAVWSNWRVRLWGRPRVTNQGTLILGGRVIFDSTVIPIELKTLPGGLIEIGDRVFINYGTSLVASAHVKIGNGCLIGPYVMLWDTDYHRVEDKSWEPSGTPIVLEDRIWTGT